jgi:hypothetical protein
LRYFIAHVIISQVYSKRIILSPAGETWIDLEAERIGTSLETGLLTFLKGGKLGLGDIARQVIIEPEYDDPVRHHHGQKPSRTARKAKRSSRSRRAARIQRGADRRLAAAVSWPDARAAA